MEEYKQMFRHYLKKFEYLESIVIEDGIMNTTKQQCFDYEDVKHCLHCDGYGEYWAQDGTIANRVEHQYEDYRKMILYCQCGRKFNHHEYVCGIGVSERDCHLTHFMQMTLLQYLCYMLDFRRFNVDDLIDPTERLEKMRARANRENYV